MIFKLRAFGVPLNFFFKHRQYWSLDKSQKPCISHLITGLEIGNSCLFVRSGGMYVYKDKLIPTR